MPKTSIDWRQLDVSRHKDVYGVTVPANLIPDLLAAVGCSNMRDPECRLKVRDYILDQLVEARRLPLVRHDDHIWFGRRGDDWYLTFISR
ncbi:MAG TPA: hypothetical protein VK008_00880 [Sphingobacteriaceae bacterium]|nr:hypothetical protein [Sphingobacteriaceae bacterium]